MLLNFVNYTFLFKKVKKTKIIKIVKTFHILYSFLLTLQSLKAIYSLYFILLFNLSIKSKSHYLNTLVLFIRLNATKIRINLILSLKISFCNYNIFSFLFYKKI